MFQWVRGATEGIDLASGQSNSALHIAIELIGEVTTKYNHIFFISFWTLWEFFVSLADLEVSGGGCDRLVGGLDIWTSAEAAMEDGYFI